MGANRVLLVDDDEVIRLTLSGVLEQSGFAVTCAANVVEALKRITAEPYDALLTDLHMPGPGDGLTVVSAMHHANPTAVKLLLSAFPNMEAAAQAILLQADEILLKPVEVKSIGDVVKKRMAIGPDRNRQFESVAAVLKRSTEPVIRDWYKLILAERLMMSVPMSRDLRCSYLRQLFRELVDRLLSRPYIGGAAMVSTAAANHGLARRRAGYSAAMLVEESRLLQFTIFTTLQNNLPTIDPSLLLVGVMTIADEVDSQLSQAMVSFTADSAPCAPPAWA